MVFASPTFLFLFLPLFLGGYYLLPRRFRAPWILAGSWLFYGWWRLDFLLLLIVSSLGAGFIGRRIARVADGRRKRIWMAAGVTLSLLVLGYFKYFNFAVDALMRLSRAAGLPSAGLERTWEVILPVGISFFTFQIISYLIDVYRGTAAEARSIIDVAAYVSLFPQLVAGPIVRYSEVAEALCSRTHSWRRFREGAGRFAFGLVRKVLIADAVAPIVDAVFGAENPGLIGAWLGLTAYTIQIYFDFSAYSDMAIGLGAMIGFRFPENFRQPYRSASITEFWRRWHITLSSWLRDYLYIPLGGSRHGLARTIVNLLTVMVLGGLWHGAAWTFVVWGAWHGAWLVAERLWGARAGALAVAPSSVRVAASRNVAQGIPTMRRLYTLIVVMIGWVFFRAEDFDAALGMVRSMVGFGGVALPATLRWQIEIGS
ncbi:MAG: MBOAT family protein, partial [Spirochaetales bacterium]|nr:MBOAT family protein [Spirochaetales bacterium]